jgi:hypothetical protein
MRIRSRVPTTTGACAARRPLEVALDTAPSDLDSRFATGHSQMAPLVGFRSVSVGTDGAYEFDGCVVDAVSGEVRTASRPNRSLFIECRCRIAPLARVHGRSV